VLQHSITGERAAKGFSNWQLWGTGYIRRHSSGDPRLRAYVVYADNTVQGLRGEWWLTTSCSHLQWSCVATCSKRQHGNCIAAFLQQLPLERAEQHSTQGIVVQ
jgi:hypothetical protein